MKAAGAASQEQKSTHRTMRATELMGISVDMARAPIMPSMAFGRRRAASIAILFVPEEALKRRHRSEQSELCELCEIELLCELTSTASTQVR